MGRGGDYDGEIGRGRQHDSSSSRESSPARGPKRSFTPTSDDGDSMTHAMVVEDDNTPPPAERPLLRQPLGFSIDQPAQSINTYEASVSAPAKLGVFLPGQEVPVAVKPKNSKQKKGTSGIKRPRRPEAYAGQTSRFRIQTYDPTPSAEPPIHYGSGPYSSLYRGVVPTTETRPETSAVASPQSRPGSSIAPSNTMDSFGQPSSLRHPQENLSATKNKATASKGKSTQTVATERRIPSSSRTKQHSSTLGSSQGSEDISSSSLSGPYYRHNYESQHEHTPSRSPPASQPQPTQSETQTKWGTIGRPQKHQLAASTSSRTTEIGEGEGQLRKPLRIVTVLIQDIRSGVTDHQLAEVKVPLKPSDDPQDGFWADARDINEQLQASASRIDGPARVYTFRGKYRQFILRVSADNIDEFISANVIIQPDRTLDIVVEMLHPPGAPPVAPKIPKELCPPRDHHDDSEELEDHMDVDLRRDQYSTSREGSRKRRTPPPLDNYDDYPCHSNPYASSSKVPRHDYPWDMSPRASPTHSTLDNAPPKNNVPPKKRRSYAKEVMRQRSHSPEPSLPLGYPRPTSESPIEEDPYEKQFIQAVSNCLQNDQVSWLGFFRAKGGDNRVHDIVKQYQFLDKICATWVGKLVPGYDMPITERHIYKAMKIDDEEFLRYFKETIGLLALYGKDGRRYEDTGIVAIVNDTQAPPSHSTVNPMKKILGALREIDAKWPTIQSSDQHQPQRLNTTEMSRDEARSTKALFV